jgi:NAD(P)-dependent dehydrogenase (short-subunit alcohol dehydrogenase family)
MSSAAPLTVPGLTGRTVLVTAAGTARGTAQSLVLLASGADVIATGAETLLPPSLVDAGTGLPGALAFRSLEPGWASVADWIGEHHAGLDGVVLNTGADLPADLRPHLAADAAVVEVTTAARAAAAPEAPRWNRVRVPAGEPGRGDAERFAAVVAFLLSELSHPVHGADLPVRAAEPVQ